MANLKDYGSSETTYPAGPNGGDLACANTTATATTPSGAVCVWVTKSTLGFTEFFTQANGPESPQQRPGQGRRGHGRPARERRKAQVLITKWAPDLGNS